MTVDIVCQGHVGRGLKIDVCEVYAHLRIIDKEARLLTQSLINGVKPAKINDAVCV